jgi:hypothetical protein
MGLSENGVSPTDYQIIISTKLPEVTWLSDYLKMV